MNDEDHRYRQLVDAITDYAIYMLDPQGRIVSWNPGAERFKGYAPAEIIGRHFSRFYTPEDIKTDLPGRALAIAAAEGRFENEGWRVRKDGTRFWAHVIIDPIRSPSREIIGYAKVTRDLTERMQATEALRRTQEQFQILVDGVTDYAIYMLDPTGHVTNWNSGAERIKGFVREEIVGAHFSTFYIPEERAEDLPARALATAAAEGQFEKEGWRVRKDGSRFWAHVVIDAIRGADGEVIGFAKVTRDITERMHAQRDLEQAREALFQSQKLEAIGHLTGGIAHDFNNLLAAVLGSLELVKNRLPHDPRISPLIDNAIMGAERGAALTQRMLAFARKQELKMEAVSIAGLITGMRDFMARTIGPTIDIEVDVSADLPAVLTDPYQLEAAVLNLAVTSRDAMPAGGSLRITARPESTPGRGALRAGDYVRLSLIDTGEGMDEATLTRATDPFFTTKGVGKGTGLGLSMVHGLMLQCGGALMLRSEPAHGTTVDLWMPIAELVGQTGERAVSAATPLGRLDGLRVLAVDDDPLVLTNTVALLEDLGCTVTAVATGRLAVDILASNADLDLLLTDQVMPQMSGLELSAEAQGLRPLLPVILATGFADLADHPHEGLWLQKPFTQKQLGAAIRSACRSLPPTPAPVAG